MLMLGVVNTFAQSNPKGTVKDSDTGVPLAGVLVQVVGSNISASTNSNGEYTLEGIPSGRYLFDYALNGYQTFEVELEVSEGMTLPDVQLKRAQADEGQGLTFSEITISSDDLESEDKDQSVSALLQSSQDAFNSAVSYTFSPARFQVRGYDSDYSLAIYKWGTCE